MVVEQKNARRASQDANSDEVAQRYPKYGSVAMFDVERRLSAKMIKARHLTR
jgi:hypothetical protein